MVFDMRNGNEMVPSPELSDEALCRLAQQGSGQAAEDLVKRYTRLVKTCARPYFLVGADEEDLLQEGMLGLMKAIREFDGRKGTPFGAFARLCVMRKIFRLCALLLRPSTIRSIIPCQSIDLCLKTLRNRTPG